MALVNHSVTNLINGVSQQSPALRLDNQVEEQINCFSDVTKGLVIRNGLELTNAVRMDLDTSNVIEFTLDGEKVVLGLDPNALVPLVHIPMTADVTALTSSINNLSYFQNIDKSNIRVLEDKDKVYILNTDKQVGEITLGSHFVDVVIDNSSTGSIDTSWSVGEYDLTVTGVNDPSAPAATENVVVAVTRSMTLSDISTLINADTLLVAETGECFITGTVSSYRITFPSIPINFIAPDVTAVETVNIEAYGGSISGDTGWIRPSDNLGGSAVSASGQYYFFFTFVGQTASSTLVTGGVTYERGAWDGYAYSIRRYIDGTYTHSYGITANAAPVTAGNNISSYPQEAMVWVTGVSSGQTYDLSITYEDITVGTPTTIPITQIAVGTITLNWVAGQVATKVAALSSSSLFTTVQYDNAVHITALGTNIITDVSVTNSFDNSSISAVIEAVENSTSGTLDITTLPPLFLEGFKVRVGSEDVSTSNYYLRYSLDFKGWKESGLDANRTLDPTTMPQIIDKEKIRKTGLIVIEEESWVTAASGDSVSNKSPSFTSREIKDMFFYGSRLGLSTDDTLVMSKIDALDTFYRSTASQSVVSDRVDIKLDSSKVGFNTIKHITTLNQSLFINTGTTQAKLLVNTAFDLTSARLSEVSSYSLGDRRPLPVENGLYFGISKDGSSNIINYQGVGNDKFDIEDLTKHCPTYINGTIDQMAYSKNLTVVSVLEDRQVLYVQNRFSKGGEMLQNSWHKWTLPHDLEYIYFFNDELKIIMSATGGYGYASGTTHTDQVINYSDTSMFTVNDSVTVRESEQTVNADFTSTVASIVPNVSITLTAGSGYTFSDNVLIDNLQTFTIMSNYTLKPQDVTVATSGSGEINWTPYLDLNSSDKTLIENFSEVLGIDKRNGIKYDNVVDAHLSTLVNQIVLSATTTEAYDLNSPVYYWRVDGNLNTIVFNGGAVISFGNNTITEYDDGGYRYFKGAEQVTEGDFGVYRSTITASSFNTTDILYGIPFTASVTLSKIISRLETQNGPVVMNYSSIMLRRMRLFLAKSGPFRVGVTFKDRKDYTMTYNGAKLGTLPIGYGVAEDFTFNFPANGKSDMMTITIETDSSTPFNLLATEWQGQLITKGRNI